MTLSRNKSQMIRYSDPAMAAGRPSNTPRSALGEKLFQARKKAGLSQTEVADALGVTQQYVAGWERQGKSLRLELLVKLAEILNTSLDGLIKSANEDNVPDKRPDSRLWRRFKEVEKLPLKERRQIIKLLDTFIENEKLRQAL